VCAETCCEVVIKTINLFDCSPSIFAAGYISFYLGTADLHQNLFSLFEFKHRRLLVDLCDAGESDN
jgi:hypothetical protein